MLKMSLTFTIALLNLVFGNEHGGILNQNLICRQILEEHPEAIFYSTEDKLYIRPEKIVPTQHGVYVGSIAIPMLLSDSSGCWLQRPQSYWICQNPKCSNYQGVFRNADGKCPICKRPGASG